MRTVRICLGGIIFILLSAYGALMAIHKPLWTDEYYSLTHSTTNISYVSILDGGVNEGNNSPLFYLLQKLQCDLFSYQGDGTRLADQFFLRIQPVIAGALSLSALFFYFSRCYSLPIGFFSLFIAMTSSMFISHWTEARPYSLWFALSLFQNLFLMNVLEGPKSQNKHSMTGLMVVHWLLALTSMVSAVQIMAAGAALWIYKRREPSLYLPLIIIPLGICCFYYFRAPHYQFFLDVSPLVLISDNIPIYRLFVILVTAVFLIFRYRSENWSAKIEIKYLIFLLLMLASFWLVLLKMKLSQPPGHNGFGVCNRYFMSLIPASIVSTVLYSVYLMRIFPSKIWALLVAAFMLFTGIIVIRP